VARRLRLGNGGGYDPVGEHGVQYGHPVGEYGDQYRDQHSDQHSYQYRDAVSKQYTKL
jgi:hypothetical protein